jgi:hypothetical protein
MRQGSNPKRSRGGRSNGKRSHQNVRTATFESNGADNKVKGTAAQVLEKYQALARDALSSGDRIMAENYLQHAEHYFRLLNPHLANDERPPEGREGEGREQALNQQPHQQPQPGDESQPRNGGAALNEGPVEAATDATEEPVEAATDATEEPVEAATDATEKPDEPEAPVTVEDSVEPSPQTA